MPTVLLVRHGRTSANTSGVLAGRTAGVNLDDTGREQVARAAERLGAVPLVTVVSSPLQRCRETARIVRAGQVGSPDAQVEDDLLECDYGDWQGRPLAELADEPMWSVVQTQPSAAVFPGGETLAQVQARAVSAIRRHDAAVAVAHGPQAVWAAVSHGDVIKAVLADALGMHLDLFQRITVDPGSVSVVRYGPTRPSVVAMNTEAGDLGWLAASPPEAEAPVGGGAGPTASPPARS